MLDLRDFPVVRVLENNTTAVAPEQQIELLLDRDEPFVILMHRTAEQHPDDTPENRKSRAKFFKSNKARLRRLCMAVILIEGGKPVPGPFKLMASGLGKAFGVPFLFVPDESAASEVAARFVSVPVGA